MILNKKLTFALAMVSCMAFIGCSSNETSSSSSSSSSTSSSSSSTSEVTTNDSESNTTTVSSSPQVLTFNLGAEPASIDPQLSTGVPGGNIINNTFEGLTRELYGEVTPAVAESWTVSEDNLVYTFIIDDKAMWSDGQPIVAGDFEYAWKRGINPATGSDYADIFASAGILNAAEILRGEMSYEELGVVALDDKTLQVTLANPTDYFLRLTAFATFMPVREDVTDPDGLWAKDASKVVCNGPFIVTEYLMSDRVVLSKNENYWDADNVVLDSVVARFIVDQSTALTAFNSGDILLNGSMPTEEIPALIIEDPEFYVLPYIGTYYYTFNLEEELFQDVNVRKALNLAIDRDALVSQVTRAGETPAAGYVGPGFIDPNGNDFNDVAGDYGIPTSGDIEAAQAALAEAGYPNGEGFPSFSILYNTLDSHQKIAEAIQEMWKQNLGINVTLENQEWAVFLDSRYSGDFEMARNGWIGDYSDPNTMLELFRTGHAQNNSNYSNEDYDYNMNMAAVTSGEERFEYLYAAEQVLMADWATIPLYYYVDCWHISDSVVNWDRTSTGKFFFGYTSIE
ncbi:MAG: ABC transporter substrate-binding protein [Epulopiscium sp. Nuni2H_MBin001]|nr:MAG: ABC transporter substrate-binding protein [Epulopiscium sp. Nuni2H_MBin001]